MPGQLFSAGRPQRDSRLLFELTNLSHDARQSLIYQFITVSRLARQLEIQVRGIARFGLVTRRNLDERHSLVIEVGNDEGVAALCGLV